MVAEMTAAFLCGATEIDRKIIKNSAAYPQGWSSRFQDDKKMVVWAAAAAQRAADYILNINTGNDQKKITSTDDKIKKGQGFWALSFLYEAFTSEIFSGASCHNLKCLD